MLDTKFLRKYYLLLLLFYALILTGCVTNYYFEVKQSDYEKLFIKKKYNSDYPDEIRDINDANWSNPGHAPICSIYFPDKTSKTWFNIEFLTEPNIKYKELTRVIGNENFLVAKIDFHSRINNIKEVDINPTYNDIPLELKGIYIGLSYDDSDPYYTREISEFSEELMSQTDQLTLFFVFNHPINWLKRIFTKKTNWYPEKMKEIIIIKYDEDGSIKNKKYEFELNWNFVSFWIT